MSQVEQNPHGVGLGDVYEDLDKGRAARRLKVIEINDGVAVLMNQGTERLTKVRLDRLVPRSNGGHGYRLVEKGPVHAVATSSVDAERSLEAAGG